MCRPVARINFGGCETPKKLTFNFWTQKVGFWTSPPLTLLQKPHIWPILWLEVDLLADLDTSLHPPWLQACGCANIKKWIFVVIIHDNIFFHQTWLISLGSSSCNFMTIISKGTFVTNVQKTMFFPINAYCDRI